jgi:hypothetical protein
MRIVRRTCPLVVTGLVALWLAPARAEEPSTEQMRRELKAMQAELRQLKDTLKEQQDLMKRQQQLIDELRTGAHPPPSVAVAPPPPVAPTPAAPPAPPPPVAQAPGWSPAQPIPLFGGARAYLNLSFDALVDAGWSTTSNVTELEPGDHDPNQRGFTLPNSEIVLDGAVDPYFKAVADIVFKLDENNDTDVELEEVYALTTSLPWNLQGKGGQFFSEFGRINQQHPHAWDFVDQPLIINRMFGPEGLRNPGARLSWLVPTPFYSELFAAIQDSQGSAAYSFRNSDTELFGYPSIDRAVHSLGDMLYVPRYVASFDLTDSQTLVAGVSGAFGPNDSASDTHTQIYGGDLYWKWKPSWQSGGFPFLAFQSEILGRRYEAGPTFDNVNGVRVQTLPGQSLDDWGFYVEQLYGFTQRWVAGLREEWVGGARPTENQGQRFRLSPDLTFYPTEFSKIRLQYNFDHQQQPLGDDSSVWLQFEFLLGAHAAHKF